MDGFNNIEEEKKEELNGWQKELVNFFKIIIISLLIVIPIRAFIVQPFIVRGASMMPTFFEKEYLIIDEFSYYFSEPERGDVIVFRYPKNPSKHFIKRIIGLPGERVEIKNGVVNIFNNENPIGLVLEEEYLASDVLTSPDTIEILDDKEYFVMGDNRYQSSDSRTWGSLDRKLIVGKTWVRLWPVARAEIL